jgi:mannose-6-phosphate isomerase-like protein (cupin superfamily)
MIIFRVAAVVFGILAAMWALAWTVDRIHPEPAPPDSYLPAAGQVLRSRNEGFTSRVLKTEGDLAWLELTLAPHAPGPPPHLHLHFPEDFAVAKGTLSLRVGSEVKKISAGEHFRVQPGVVHQPFNETDEEVVVRGPFTAEFSLPRPFVLFLSQVYGFMDESPSQGRAPALLLQLSLFSPRYDIWLASSPMRVQRILSGFLRPIARAFGYRSYYQRFVLPPVVARSE